MHDKPVRPQNSVAAYVVRCAAIRAPMEPAAIRWSIISGCFHCATMCVGSP